MRNGWIGLSVLSVVWTASVTEPASAEPPLVSFDLPQVAVATTAREASASQGSRPEASDNGDAEIPARPDPVVTFELQLSSMIASPDAPRIDQWLVRCEPRDERLLIRDYSPKTELAASTEGAINVRQSDETNQHFGFGVDGSYGHALRGNLGMDAGEKSSETLEFKRLPSVQAVTAAGTIRRGRGVYFKLRWTHSQVLEGQKRFRVSVSVPSGWRGGLVDVSVVAQSKREVLGGLDTEIETLGEAHFVVAVFRKGDDEARLKAMDLAHAEMQLRRMARVREADASGGSLAGLFRSVALKFDRDRAAAESRHWIERLVRGSANPHLDKRIRKLPTPLRVAALDYCDRRNEFLSLNQASDRSEAALAGLSG
jgi:hypothetical protein